MEPGATLGLLVFRGGFATEKAKSDFLMRLLGGRVGVRTRPAVTNPSFLPAVDRGLQRATRQRRLFLLQRAGPATAGREPALSSIWELPREPCFSGSLGLALGWLVDDGN